MGIGLTEKFKNETNRTVTKEETEKNRTLGHLQTMQDIEQQEKKGAFPHRFVELTGVTGVRTGTGEDHPPGMVGDAPP